MIYCNNSNQTTYPFNLPDLPFNKDSFKPHFTSETFDYHHGKHHQTYVTNLNNLIENKGEFANMSLEEIIMSSNNKHPSIFNNAAQVWNHTFFWHSIKPNGGQKPNGSIMEKINEDFSNFENFTHEFKQAATTQFGSGWAWLVYNNGRLNIVKTSNAETPITQGQHPLLACDVWEHAYYIDYRNKRPDYVSTYIEHMINWEFAQTHFDYALKLEND